MGNGMTDTTHLDSAVRLATVASVNLGGLALALDDLGTIVDAHPTGAEQAARCIARAGQARFAARLLREWIRELERLRAPGETGAG